MVLRQLSVASFVALLVIMFAGSAQANGLGGADGTGTSGEGCAGALCAPQSRVAISPYAALTGWEHVAQIIVSVECGTISSPDLGTVTVDVQQSADSSTSSASVKCDGNPRRVAVNGGSFEFGCAEVQASLSDAQSGTALASETVQITQSRRGGSGCRPIRKPDCPVGTCTPDASIAIEPSANLTGAHGPYGLPVAQIALDVQCPSSPTSAVATVIYALHDESGAGVGWSTTVKCDGDPHRVALSLPGTPSSRFHPGCYSAMADVFNTPTGGHANIVTNRIVYLSLRSEEGHPPCGAGTEFPPVSSCSIGNDGCAPASSPSIAIAPYADLVGGGALQFLITVTCPPGTSAGGTVVATVTQSAEQSSTAGGGFGRMPDPFRSAGCGQTMLLTLGSGFNLGTADVEVSLYTGGDIGAWYGLTATGNSTVQIVGEDDPLPARGFSNDGSGSG